MINKKNLIPPKDKVESGKLKVEMWWNYHLIVTFPQRGGRWHRRNGGDG
jgi:hypothetical protein